MTLTPTLQLIIVFITMIGIAALIVAGFAIPAITANRRAEKKKAKEIATSKGGDTSEYAKKFRANYLNNSGENPVDVDDPLRY